MAGIDLLKKRAAGIEHFVLENEARIVGSCSVPVELHRTMQTLPILVLEDRFENRVERILRDYVVLLREEFVQLHGAEQGDFLFAERLRDSMNRIRKRLGGALHQELSVVLDCALELQLRDGSIDAHRQWIERLLNDYYDPMYHYQQSKVRERVVFRGDQAAILAFVAAQQD